MALNIENDGEGSCDGDDDDLLETGVRIEVARGTCADGNEPVFDFFIDPFVEHDIGSFSYGTFFGPNVFGTVAAKISELPTPPATCGTWSFNLQATKLNLSSIVPLAPIALYVADSDEDPECFDISDAQVGNAIVKPHQGLHHARR